ncbi:MAG TPA: arginine--tRNA ligase [Bacteroidetes bacterium]|nr:arginine--tRNA ligase [Bacteroidota bacterium]
MRNAPPKLAAMLASKLPDSGLVAEVKPTGPYLNFVLSKEKLGEWVAKSILDGSFFQKKLTAETPRTMIEYSQPNTHKEMHVGHMRNLALGDALIRMHRYAGYDIVSATFPGDVGTHVAKCLWYLKYHNQEPIPETGRGAWLGKMYVCGTGLLAEMEGTEREAEAKKQMTDILKQLEAKEGDFYELWKETREWSIAQMEAVYAWANVKFDAWYWESDVDTESVAYVKEQYAKGMFQESDGAVGMDLSEDNLGFCLLLKSDGTGLYATKDVELARRKFQDNGIEKSVYIVDKRQEWHFKQVFKVLEKMGFEQAKNCYHLQYDYVEGKEGMFSSRLGNAVPVVDLIEQMTAAIRKDYLENSVAKGIMTAEEAEKIAVIVAQGAIKYGMVKIDPAKKIIFNMEEWIRISGDSGPYQQYTFARINSLCKKQGFDANGPFDWEKLGDAREVELLVKASRFNDVALSASQSYKPSLLTNYLYDLAQLYNNLNNAVFIRDISDPVEKNSRMAVHMVVAKVIEKGLAIMGIPVPEKM